MSGKTILGDLLGYFPVKLLPAFAAVLLIVFATRILSQEDYVTFSVSTAICAITMQFGVGWIGSPIIFYSSIVRNKRLFHLSVVALVCFAAILSSIVVGLLVFFYAGGALLALAVAFLCLTQSTSNAASVICQAKRDVRTQFVMVLATSSILGLAIYLLSIGYFDSLAALFCTISFAYLVSLLVFFHVTRFVKNLNTFGVGLPRLILWPKRLVSYGAPFSLWVGGTLLIISCDKFFVKDLVFSGAYLSAKDLLVGMSSLLSMPIIMALHPVIISVSRAGSDYWIIIKNAVDLLSYLYGGLACLLNSFGFVLLGNLTGVDYSTLGMPLTLTFFGLYLGACLIYFQKGLEVDGRTVILANVVFGAGVVALGLSAVLVPKGGLLVGAGVFVFSQLLCVMGILTISGRIMLIIRPCAIFFSSYLACGAVVILSDYLLGAENYSSWIFSAFIYSVSIVIAGNISIRRMVFK